MENAGCIHDRYLVREAQDGNHRAFAQLVHAHDEGVLNLAFRITGSQSDAQDIYQETFLKVYKGLAGFQFHSSFSTWIYRIAINACLDHLRKNRNRRESNAIQLNAGRRGVRFAEPNLGVQSYSQPRARILAA